MNHRLAIFLVSAAFTASASANTTLLTENFSAATPGGERNGAIPGSFFQATAGNVDIIGNINGNFFTCAGGGPISNNCLDLNGLVPGSIQTTSTFALAQGVTYTVSFDVQAAPNAHPFNAFLGNSGAFSFTTLAAGQGFAPESFSYTPSANESAARLKFVSLSTVAPQYNGPVLDNIVQTAIAAPVPEPETYVMLLVGLGLLGFVARRRKQKAA